MLTCVVLLLVASGVTVADVESRLWGMLNGEDVTAADAQRALSELMGWCAHSPSGVVVGGQGVRVADYDVRRFQREIRKNVPARHFLKVTGIGPAPLRVRVPVDSDTGEIEVYRRVSRGLYVRILDKPRHAPNYVSFETRHPGKFVVREIDEHSNPPLPKCLSPDVFAPSSSGPEAKAKWRLFRVEPDRIAGAVPVILIHGLGTDRWGEFIHWAANSLEAEGLRANFQLWDFQHEPQGVDAPIGFSPDYPAFEESIIAYLNRFIIDATETGVETDGVRYFLPDGPMCLLAHSHGGLKARAFMKNFPEQAERVVVVISVDAPHTGAPLAIPEWFRHTLTRVGVSTPSNLGLIIQGGIADLFMNFWMSKDRQSDLDAGWGNFDAQGGFGIPMLDFRAFSFERGFMKVSLSPRDANQDGARYLPGYDDCTFEPEAPLSTYCGGLDAVMPERRGENHLDKFILYGAYLTRISDWFGLLGAANKALQDPVSFTVESVGIRMAHVLMSIVASAGGDAPLGVYALGDGFTPLQSQLMLDGRQTELIYETKVVDGWRVPVIPYRHRDDIIREHTLVNPENLRILAGWTHLDTITGRYSVLTGHSRLFSMWADDLLDAIGISRPVTSSRAGSDANGRSIR